MGHGNTIVLVTGTVFMFGALAGFHYLNNQSIEHLNAVANLTAQVDRLEFSLSCTVEGSLSNLDQRNCIERGDYRIVRSGFDAIIYKISDAKPVAVFHSSPDIRRRVPGRRDEISEIARAFSGDPP